MLYKYLNALRPQASADDGKRRTAVLEVDVSPLRATKGGILGGEEPPNAGGDAGPRRICMVLGALGRLFLLFVFIFSVF